MAKIRVLRDYQYEGWEELGKALAPGTVIDNAELVPDLFNDGVGAVAARYAHPTTGNDWISYSGAYEIIG